MNVKHYFIILLATSAWLFFESNAPAQGQPSASKIDPVYAEIFSNAPPAPSGFATRLDYLKSFTNEGDAIRAYRKGLISKNEVLWAHFLIGNAKSQDFYGKVVDQYGQPVIGANVIGYLRLDEGLGINDEKVEEYKTKTDTEGLFQFTGLHGAQFGQKVSKAGYEMGQGTGFYVSPNSEDKTSPTQRAIFNMWKFRGTEPMIHVEAGAGIACDGSPTRFDLLSGKKSSNGDLIVKLTRNPVNIDRRRPFNWSVTLEIPNGGFQEITNLYPNEAPVEGYQ
jgi:hypothetical protein